MIKVMLIDDEPEIRRLLHKMVEKQEGYQVVSECGNFAGAVADFARYRPDVVFVDIDLNGEDGLNCARVLTDLDPKLKVIFATAHSEYMANAFEIYAFDYLVKPFNMERLARTLDRIRSSMPEHARQGSMQNAVPGQAHAAGLRETRGNAQPTSYTPDNCDMQNKARSMAYTADGGNMPDATRSTTPAADSCTPQRGMQPGTNTPNPCIPQGKAGSPDKIARPDRYRGKLLIKGKEQTFLLDVEEILFIERMDGNTNIVTASGEQYRTSASLFDLETKLDSELFMRCHKSYIVNLSKITRIEPYGRWTYVAKFRGCELSALMTAQKYEEMKRLFS